MDWGSVKAALRDKLCPRQNLFYSLKWWNKNLKALGYLGRLMYNNADGSSVPCPHGSVQKSLPLRVSFIYLHVHDWWKRGNNRHSNVQNQGENIFEKNYEIHFIPENWIFWKQLALYNNWRMCCRFHCLDSVKTLARRLSSELCFFFYIICKEKEHAPSSPS